MAVYAIAKITDVPPPMNENREDATIISTGMDLK
jgi:hypothetical protein